MMSSPAALMGPRRRAGQPETTGPGAIATERDQVPLIQWPPKHPTPVVLLAGAVTLASRRRSRRSASTTSAALQAKGAESAIWQHEIMQFDARASRRWPPRSRGERVRGGQRREARASGLHDLVLPDHGLGALGLQGQAVVVEADRRERRQRGRGSRRRPAGPPGWDVSAATESAGPRHARWRRAAGPVVSGWPARRRSTISAAGKSVIMARKAIRTETPAMKPNS